MQVNQNLTTTLFIQPHIKITGSFYYYFKDPINTAPSLLRPTFYGPTVVTLTLFHLHLNTLMLSPSALYSLAISMPQRAYHHSAYCTHSTHKNLLCKNNLRAATKTLFNILMSKVALYSCWKVRNCISVLRVCSIDCILEQEYTDKSPGCSSAMIFGPVESYRQKQVIFRVHCVFC